MKRLALIVLSVLLFIWIIQVAAQESTPEPDQTVQVTVSSGEPSANEGSTVVLSALQVVMGLVSAFAIGGVVGIAGVGILAARLRHDAVTLAAIEKLGDSVPPETAAQIMNLTGQFNASVNELTALVNEVLDGIPAAGKPQL